MSKLRFLPLLLGALLLALTSCDNIEKNSNTPLSDQPATVKAIYQVHVGEGWFRAYDITLTYTDIEGNVQTTELTQSTIYNRETDYAAAPESYRCSITAKPKASPDLDDNAEYDMSRSIALTVNSYYDNGKLCQQFGNSYVNEGTATATGREIREHLQEQSLGSFEGTKK